MTLNPKGAVLAAAALWSISGAAETLPISGIYPAGSDSAAAMEVIAVERFGGADGQQLGIAIADRLRAVTIEGQPWFRVVPDTGSGDFDALLQGTATAEIGRREAGTREEETCAERDEDRKCLRKVKEKIPCWSHVVRLDASVRLVGREGELLDAFDREDEETKRYCQGDSRPSSEGLVRQLAGRYADAVRANLAPVERAETTRVMESRKGLADDDSRAFREAVRLTKTDNAAACAAWAALEPRNPQHISVLFNLGLCAESVGDLDQADAYYRRAVTAQGDTSYIRQGLERIAARRRADAQLANRGLL